MVYACNEEGVRLLRQMSSSIENSIEEIKILTDSVRTVATDNYRTLGPHIDSLNEALDDIKSSVEQSTCPILEISYRLGNIANKYQEVIYDDPFSDSFVSGMDGTGYSGGGVTGSGKVGLAGNSANITVSPGAPEVELVTAASTIEGAKIASGTDDSLSVKNESAEGNSDGMEPVLGAKPRNLSHTKYGYSRNKRGESEYDSPMEMDKYLYASQGSANLNYKGTCGLCSCANILRLAGVLIGEGDMIEFASSTKDLVDGTFLSPNLCVTNSVFSGSRGATGPIQRKQILEHFGIRSELVDVPLIKRGGVIEVPSTVTDAIADYVSEGKGVILSVHASKLDPVKYGNRKNDYHAVTVTSVTRDIYKKPIGFYICDSNQGTKFYYADEISSALTGSQMNVTSQIIR